MAVTGNTRKIIDQGILGTRDPIEKCGFTDIGPTDNGNDGFHGKFSLYKMYFLR
jgi:hypothetical protein